MSTGERGRPPTAVVRRYLDRLVAHDWPAVSDCLADDVLRLGPFADDYRGREPYVTFLSGLMPSLPGYSMRIDRILRVEGGGDPDGAREEATVIAELTETVEVDGALRDTAEVLVFELGPDGRITRIAIYIRRG